MSPLPALVTREVTEATRRGEACIIILLTKFKQVKMLHYSVHEKRRSNNTLLKVKVLLGGSNLQSFLYVLLSGSLLLWIDAQLPLFT
jgi:hypothetical protein